MMTNPIRPLCIGGVKLENNLIMAPVAGITDAGFRYWVKYFGAGLAVGEMVSIKALYYKNAQTAPLLAVTKTENPCCAQIFGSDPDIAAYVLQNEPELDKFDIIDINMGCPVAKIVCAGDGSALMKKPELAGQMVEKCVGASKGRPITVKMRLGWDQDSINCVELACLCEQKGAAAITIHGRTKAQAFSGTADHSYLKAVKQAVKIPVIANGDICTYDDILRIYEHTGADGFMIGRAAFGKPFIFAQLLNNQKSVSLFDIIQKHIEILTKILPERIVALNLRTHLNFYLKGHAGARTLKAEINTCESTQKLLQLLKDI